MYIDILILSQLIHGPKHGYKIKKNVAFVLGDAYNLNNNALYPRLKKFEEMGAVKKEIKLQEGSPNRFLYSITDIGKSMFERLLQEVNEDTAKDENEFHNKLAFFSLLSEENKEKILTFRINYLEKQLDFMDKMIQVVKDDDYMPFSKQLYAYTKGMLTYEIELVENLRRFSSD